MADLIAQGPHPHERWKRVLPEQQPMVLGRAAGTWSVPWDAHISRRHVEMLWEHGQLKIKRLETGRNPVYVNGREVDSCILKPGEHFVIGATTFSLTDARAGLAEASSRPVAEQTFSAAYLQELEFRNPNQRLEVLSRVPDMISGAGTDEEMSVRLVNVLLTGVQQAAAAAIVKATEEGIQILHWDRRTLMAGDFHPSERLIRQALTRQESVLHVWSRNLERAPSFTVSEDADWAFCVPVRGEACRGWAIYAAGRHGEATDPNIDVRDELKFAELVASTLSSLREVRLLERNHTSLSQFFSPIVLAALEGQDPEKVLAPRESDVTVLFCDLRGFSRRSEEAADDLLGLLNRVSAALGVTTRAILEQGGVVGDFHGDAVMGFWGWPIPQADAAERACRTALRIRREFSAAARDEQNPLSGFQIGMGIATGRAVAGKIGTVDQVKVTVFGPVVNLASRLEGMTKILRAPILLDSRTAEAVRGEVPAETARLRRVAVVRPYGLATSLEVSELLPPEAEYPQLSAEQVAAYEAAVDALLARDWNKAFELLHRVPTDDRVKDFLTVFIAQHNRTPPIGWDGVIPLTTK